jgi:TonB family protein
MSAHRLQLCAGGRAFLILVWMSSALCVRGKAQQPLPAATAQPQPQIAALAERLALQFLAAGKKRPLFLDLTLPNDSPCPLGAWLADQISGRLAQAHPELEVVPRNRWASTNELSQPVRDRNEEFAFNEQRALLLGAQVLVQGNFAAIPGGIGITLLATDRLVGRDSRFEALAEVPLTEEFTDLFAASIPHRISVQGAFEASTAGIGSPLCEDCPPPAYTYIARAKKLSGVVIAQVLVSVAGSADNIKIVRAPDPALAKAALRTVRTWRFKPARNFQGDFVPVIVDVAVSFRLDAFRQPPTSASNRKY